MHRLSAQSVLHNTEDMARWCAERAHELDELSDRPIGPEDCRRVIDINRELLTRISQQQSFMAAMVFHEAAPWWVWWRAFLWGIRLRGKR